jgi:hypothetical protein
LLVGIARAQYMTMRKKILPPEWFMKNGSAPSFSSGFDIVSSGFNTVSSRELNERP